MQEASVAARRKELPSRVYLPIENLEGGLRHGAPTERLAAWPRAARARYAVAFLWSQRAHIASPSDSRSSSPPRSLLVRADEIIQ